MERYTKEQMAVLQEFENNFYTALHAGYSRNITGDKIKIMEETTGLKCGNRSCTHCVLTFLRTIGEKYFYTKENPPIEPVKVYVVEETEPEGFPPKLPATKEELIKHLEEMPEESKQMIEKITATFNEQNGKKRGRPKKGSV